MKLPALEDLIDLHAESIARFGGARGLRDRGALDASLARAGNIVAYGEHGTDAVDVAVGVCASICRNHAFIDGNKRIAFLALGIILELNGFYLDVRENDAISAMTKLASSAMSEEEFTNWVRTGVVKAF